MQIRLTFIFLMLIGLGASAQKKLLPVYKHSIIYPDHKVTFQLQDNMQERKFTDPKKMYHWFSSNQIKVTQGGFSGKLLHGIYTDYYLNQSLKEQGKFNMGLKTGEWRLWTEKGVLKSKVNYREGILSGTFFTYDSLGNLAASGSYRNGLLHGKLTKTIGKDSVQVLRYNNGIVKPAQPKRSFFSKLFFWRKS